MAFDAFTGFAFVEPMTDGLHYEGDHRPASYMSSWSERVQSFHTWPLDIKPFPAAMAAAGFYHSNKNTDTVTCFSCNREFPDWKKHDDPIRRHLQHSSVPQYCDYMDKVTKQPTQYIPLTPPATPPVSASASIPHKCTACQGTFPSSSTFHKHRREAHKRIHGRIGIPLKRPGGVLLGKLGDHWVSKPTKERRKNKRRGNTDLFD